VLNKKHSLQKVLTTKKYPLRGIFVTDKIKETLSAWIDDEASEIEIHRLLRHYDADDSARQTWLGLQHTRALVRGDSGPSLEQHVSLHLRISSAIDADEVVHDNGRGLGKAASLSSGLPAGLPSALPNWAKPAGGLALAASLVVAVFLGVQQGKVEPLESAAVDSGSNRQSITQPISVQTVGTQTSQQGVGMAYNVDPAYQFDKQLASDQTDLKALDEDKQRQLRAYLRQHDQMARINPNARTVIYEVPKSADLPKN